LGPNWQALKSRLFDEKKLNVETLNETGGRVRHGDMRRRRPLADFCVADFMHKIANQIAGL
jgi:hypothetical protein